MSQAKPLIFSIVQPESVIYYLDILQGLQKSSTLFLIHMAVLISGPGQGLYLVLGVMCVMSSQNLFVYRVTTGAGAPAFPSP